MLEDARRRAAAANRYSRGAAVVALDATVERAAYLVALRRNLSLGDKATLNDIHSRLVESLDHHWRPAVWGQVRNLREARNGAQHKGLVPDRDELPGWIAATEAYVHSLVLAEYSVDLKAVVLADAIADGHLANLVRTAGDSLAAGDITGSVKAATYAFDAAVARWSALYKRSVYRPGIASHLGFMGNDQAAKALAELDRQAVEASFASSVAELHWFNSARKEPVDVLDADDADRILAFVFSWVVAFEVALSEWVPDRRHRADVAARRIRTSGRRAGIAAVGRVTRQGIGYAVTFQLEDVPDANSYDAWAETLGRLLASDDERKRWRVAPDGRVSLTTFGGAQPSGEDVSLLDQALAGVEDAVESARLERAHAEAQMETQRAQHEADLDQIRDQIPDWVTSVTWVPRALAGLGPGWLFSVTDEAGRLRFGPATEAVTAGQGIEALIRAHPKVEQCFGTRGGAVILPLIPATALVDVFRNADNLVRPGLTDAERSRLEQATRMHEIEAELAAALISLRGAP